jgi:hypothetical protein
MTTFLMPPPPQDRDRRTFQKGDRVRAHFGFAHGCPPAPNEIPKGSLGTVTAEPTMRSDPFFAGFMHRMVQVKWDTGISGEVVDRMLDKQTET